MTIGRTAARRASHREPGTSGVESELARLVPADVPQGLRGRTLARAGEARRGAALRPWMRVTTAVCALLIVATLGFDTIVGRHEDARLAALLGRPMAVDAGSGTAPELAEAGFGTGAEAARWARLQDLAASRARRSMEKETVGALNRLKGRWDYETSQGPD